MAFEAIWATDLPARFNMPLHADIKQHRGKKPSKPFPSFPLTPHNNGQWCKKIRGKIRFFGVWDEPDAALENYLRVASDLHAGRNPVSSNLSSGGVTVKDVANHYLTHQLHKVEAGELALRSFEDCRSLVEDFARYTAPGRLVDDLRPEDFQNYRLRLVRSGLKSRGRGLGVHALTRTITVIRGMFKHAYEVGLLASPIRYGTGFNRPSAALCRKARRASEIENGKRLFTPSEIRTILEVASIPLKAMILLGINGGFGNADCARLPLNAVNLETNIIEFARPKTGVERVVPLWSETAQSLRAASAVRPAPSDADSRSLVFLTSFGRPWVRERVHRNEANGVTKIIPIDAISHEFNKTLADLGLRRKGLGFYALRHTFRTWADEVHDQHAIHRIMGHTIPGMSGVYVEEISLDRLQAVTNHVRSKIFQEGSTTT